MGTYRYTANAAGGRLYGKVTVGVTKLTLEKKLEDRNETHDEIIMLAQVINIERVQDTIFIDMVNKQVRQMKMEDEEQAKAFFSELSSCVK